jgi:hypothetical protein
LTGGSTAAAAREEAGPAAIRLRPHHLLCVLTFVGRGYDEAFTANLAAIVERLDGGTEIALVEDADDICGGGCAPQPHCRGEPAAARDRAASLDIARVLSRAAAPGARLALRRADWAALRRAFAEGGARAACAGCPWADLCTTVAADGFAAARLRC